MALLYIEDVPIALVGDGVSTMTTIRLDAYPLSVPIEADTPPTLASVTESNTDPPGISIDAKIEAIADVAGIVQQFLTLTFSQPPTSGGAITLTVRLFFEGSKR